MAKVNWFPGHMAKTLRQMNDEIKNVDMLIYMLDARAPLSCLNPSFSAIALQKPVLYVLNKADIANKAQTDKAKQIIKQKYKGECITLNSVLSGANKTIEPLMKELCKDKIEKFANKGIKTYLRAMVVGVPNSGKSTLINNLCGKAKTITGDKAGVTRGKQWLSLKNGFEVLDTPGTLWPNFEDETIAHNLALIGSVKNEVVDMGELCISLLKFMINNYKDNLEEKYNIEIELEPNQEYDVVEYVDVIDLIAKRKNHLLKGGEVDYDRACFAIVDDFRKGKLGFVSLEKLV